MIDLKDLEQVATAAMQQPDRAGSRIVTMLASDAMEIANELHVARGCVARVYAHVLNDEIYCARCMEALVAYQKIVGLPLTRPEDTRTVTGEMTEL